MTPEAERATLRKVTWRLIPFLFLLYIVAYLDRVNVGFAQLQMKESIGLTDKAFGLGAGIFFLGYFLFEVPSNLILERVGARFWITRIMMTWGVIAMAMLFTKSAVMFCTMRFLLGLAEAGFFPGVILYLTYWYTQRERARIIGLFMTATALASIIGGPISGYLLTMHGLGGLMGWQWLYLLEGLPAVLLGFVVLAYLPNGPADARWLRQEERDWLKARHHDQPCEHHTLREALVNPKVWLFGIIYFGIAGSMYGINMWLPQIIKGFSGLSNLQVGFLSAIPSIGAAVGMVLIGVHSDRTGERRFHNALPMLIGSLGLLMSAYVHSPVASLLCLTLAATGISGALGPFWAQPTAMLGKTAAAAGIAFINSLGNLGGFAGPYLVGYVKNATGNYTGGLLALAGIAFVGGLTALTIQRPPLPQAVPTPVTADS